MRGIQIWHNDSNIEKQFSGSLLGSFLDNILLAFNSNIIKKPLVAKSQELTTSMFEAIV